MSTAPTEDRDWKERFDEEWPQFEGVGAPFPIFRDHPNRNHIMQFISQEITTAEARGEKAMLEKIYNHCGLDDPECEHGFNPAEECANLTCGKREKRKIYKDMSSALTTDLIDK